MKKYIILLITLLLTGCTESEIETKKDEYLVFKEDLLEQTTFNTDENINFDITISIDKVSDEEFSYRAIIDNPRENMYNIKAIVIHNHFTNDVFPTIGIFDDEVDLLLDSEEVKGINLVGYIQTTKDISELDLDIRVYIEYTNDNDELVKIYYKTTK